MLDGPPARPCSTPTTRSGDRRRVRDRAGLHALRAPARSRARQGEPAADRRARPPSSSATGTARTRSRRSRATTGRVGGPARADGRPGAARRRICLSNGTPGISTLDLFGGTSSSSPAPKGRAGAPAAKRPAEESGCPSRPTGKATNFFRYPRRLRRALRRRLGQRLAPASGRLPSRGVAPGCRGGSSRAPRCALARLAALDGRRGTGTNSSTDHSGPGNLLPEPGDDAAAFDSGREVVIGNTEGTELSAFLIAAFSPRFVSVSQFVGLRLERRPRAGARRSRFWMS